MTVRQPRARLARRPLTREQVTAARTSSVQTGTPAQEAYLLERGRLVEAFVTEHALHDAEFGDETPEQRAELDQQLAELDDRYSHLG